MKKFGTLTKILQIIKTPQQKKSFHCLYFFRSGLLRYTLHLVKFALLNRSCQWILSNFHNYVSITIANIKITYQFSSVAQSCPTLCNPMNCSTPGLLVHHQLLEFTQTHALVAQMVKRLPTMRGTWVQYLGWEDLLEKGMATYSSTLAPLPQPPPKAAQRSLISSPKFPCTLL